MERDNIFGLSLDTLHEIHQGRIKEQLQVLLDALVQDLVDRPGEKGKRQVSLTLSATPKTFSHDIGPGQTRLETIGAEVSIELASKRPKHKAEELDFRLEDGELKFNASSARDFNAQSHLPGMYEEDDENPAVKMPGA